MSDLMSLVSMGSVREKYDVRKLHGVCRCDVQVRGECHKHILCVKTAAAI